MLIKLSPLQENQLQTPSLSFTAGKTKPPDSLTPLAWPVNGLPPASRLLVTTPHTVPSPTGGRLGHVTSLANEIPRSKREFGECMDPGAGPLRTLPCKAQSSLLGGDSHSGEPRPTSRQRAASPRDRLPGTDYSGPATPPADQGA